MLNPDTVGAHPPIQKVQETPTLALLMLCSRQSDVAMIYPCLHGHYWPISVFARSSAATTGRDSFRQPESSSS